MREGEREKERAIDRQSDRERHTYTECLCKAIEGVGSRPVAMALGSAALFVLTLTVHAAGTCPGEKDSKSLRAG